VVVHSPWSFPWYSSGDTDFNYDFGASFTADEVASGAPVYNYGFVAISGQI
jgi:predicted dithiol-disulfide oxidoreductase (DUF899 family)